MVVKDGTVATAQDFTTSAPILGFFENKLANDEASPNASTYPYMRSQSATALDIDYADGSHKEWGSCNSAQLDGALRFFTNRESLHSSKKQNMASKQVQLAIEELT